MTALRAGSPIFCPLGMDLGDTEKPRTSASDAPEESSPATSQPLSERELPLADFFSILLSDRAALFLPQATKSSSPQTVY